MGEKNQEKLNALLLDAVEKGNYEETVRLVEQGQRQAPKKKSKSARWHLFPNLHSNCLMVFNSYPCSNMVLFYCKGLGYF